MRSSASGVASGYLAADDATSEDHERLGNLYIYKHSNITFGSAPDMAVTCTGRYGHLSKQELREGSQQTNEK